MTGWRQIWRLYKAERAVTAGLLVTFALGISIPASLLSVLDRSLVRGLPFAESHQLVSLLGVDKRSGALTATITDQEFETVANLRGEMLSAITSFSFSPQSAALAHNGAIRALSVVFADSLFVETLMGPRLAVALSCGQAPRCALLFPGGPMTSSETTWRGATVRVGEKAYPVAGVLPTDFALPALSGQAADAVVIAAQSPQGGLGTSRTIAVARLESHRSRAEVQAAIDGAIGSGGNSTVRVVSLRDALIGEHRTWVMNLSLAGVTIWLLAAVNAVILAMSTYPRRAAELRVREALGGTHLHLLRQFGWEVLPLVLGCVVTAWIVHGWSESVVNSLLPRSLRQIGAPTTSSRALLTVTACSGLIFAFTIGSLGTFYVARRSGTITAVRLVWISRAKRFAGDAIVALHATLAVLLILVAAFLLESYRRLSATTPGFAWQEALVVTALPPSYERRGHEFYDRVVQSLGKSPYLSTVGLSDSLSIAGERPERPLRLGLVGEPIGGVVRVSSSFFRALGMEIQQGRTFTAIEDHRDAPVVVVTASAASRLFPGRVALGQSITVAPGEAPREVIGVAGDVRRSFVLGPLATVYVPMADRFGSRLSIVARSKRGSANDAQLDIAGRILAIAPDATVRVRSAKDLFLAGVTDQREEALMLALLGAVAFALAVVGIAAIVTARVAAQAHAFAIRMCLGATHGVLVRGVLDQAAVSAGAGVVCGYWLSRLAGALFAERLHGVQPGDPTVAAAVAVVVLTVVLSSAYVPARRLYRLDPAAVLRITGRK